MAFAGQKTRKAVRISTGLFFILLTTLSFTFALPISPVQTSPRPDLNGGPAQPGSIGSRTLSPRIVGATPLSGMSLPETVVSSVDNMLNSGVVSTSQDNLTLYNRAVRMRLLGGLLPRDELLGPTGGVMSSYSWWNVQANISGIWVPLIPYSNNFTIIGTNRTGTFVVRNMGVKNGPYSGLLWIYYKALSAGPLKWDVGFRPDVTGQYRLYYSIWNLTSAEPLASGSRQIGLHFASSNYTLSWNDIPASLSNNASTSNGQFALTIDLGKVSAASTNYVDPSIIASCSSCVSTTDIVRRIFYEPKGGFYWVFYDDGTYLRYKNSRDGTNWSAAGTIPFADPGVDPAQPTKTDNKLPVYYSGQQVIVAKGGWWYYSGQSPYSAYGYLYYSIGNITGSTIAWGSVKVWDAPSRTCSNGSSSCSLYVGVRSINLGASSDGSLAVSFDWFSWGDAGTGLCPGVVSGGENAIVVRYKTQRLVTSCVTSQGLQIVSSIYRFDNVLPSDSSGGMRVLYSQNGLGLYSQWLDGLNHTATIETISPPSANGSGSSVWSAVADSNYGIHVVYQGTNNVSYAYRSASGLSWISSLNIFGLQTTDPTITVDQTTNDVYAFGIFGQNYSIVMKRKPLAQSWPDQSPVFPITRLSQGSQLGSNYASASGTSSSTIMLVWQEYVGNYQYNTMFASIPMENVWSPFGYSGDPWDGYGISPYVQYFSNLGEYVSTSTGMLTVRQTDLTLAGRGIDLSITHVYTEPTSFLYGPSIEKYPWAPIGNGWQLDFPWMENVSDPTYVHLVDGQGYRIPSSFWNSCGLFDNHQGENFRLTQFGTLCGKSIRIFDKSGNIYTFDSMHSNRLITIGAPSGNSISFGYDSNNRIANITDSVGRVFQFCYANGLLHSINQTSGNCASSAGSVRGVVFGYSGQSLQNVTDPAGRVTSYQYQAVRDPSAAPWLLSRITYATRTYTNYTYIPFLMGTEATSYRVKLQYVGSPSSSGPIRQFGYQYTDGAGDQVNNSTITTYDGKNVAGYTSYGFSFAGDNQTFYDSTHSFLHGVQQRFGMGGEVVNETVMVSPTQGYSNYYGYDLWGNMIYSHQAINASANLYHDKYNAYYNGPLQPAFYSFEETFSQNQGNSTDNTWNIQNGYWMVQNGVYNGTETRGDQKSMFAWTGSTSPNVTIQAQVYIARSVNASDQKVGIFVHYPGSGTGKWALVLYNSSIWGPSLSLFDEQYPSGWLAESSCSILRGRWYTFTLSVVGESVQGTATTADGLVNCGVSWTFPTSDGISAATGFGVYAGGYSALFDNITAVPIQSLTYGTGFSNSFVPECPPTCNSFIHDSIAGSAELQNGAGSLPIETYYTYYGTGRLNQVEQRHNVFDYIQWPTTSRTYDSHGNLATLTDANGNMFYYSYASAYKSAYLTNQTQVVGTARTTSLYGYNFTLGTKTSSVDPNGYNSTYQYDILGRTTRIRYPTGDYTTYTYNDVANYVNITNENGWRSQQDYDGLGRLTSIVRFSTATVYPTESYSYNWQDKTATMTDALGNVTRYRYDALGRVTNATTADGNSVLTTYNDLASWVRTRDQNQVYTCSVFDMASRLISLIENANSICSSGIVTNYYYDEAGNLVRVTTPNLQSTMYTYDNLNRLVKTSYPDGTAESYSYDNDGNVVSKTDRIGVQITYSYDSLNRVQVVKYYGTIVTNDTYAYDKNSNLIKLQSQNATLSYTYDARNRVTCEKYAINGATSISGPCGTGGGGSVAAGTLITLANGTSIPVQRLSVGMKLLSYNVTTSQYAVSTISSFVTVDTDNMLVINTQNSIPLRVDNATTQRLWVKTSSGTVGWLSVTELRAGDSLFLPLMQKWTLVTSIEKASGGNHLMYDIYTTSPGDYIADGYLDPVKQGPTPPTPPGIITAGYSFTYTYTGEALSQITYNDMDVVSYAYDSLGRVQNVTQSPVSPLLLVKLSYYRNDQVSNMTYGSGVKASYTYDKLARPLNITYYGSRQLVSLVYSYNKTGTVASVVGQVNGTRVNEQYRYDALQRLTNATIANGAVNSTFWYQYDSAGNRINQCCTALTNSSFSPTNNELLQTSRRISPGHYATSASYAYDSDGDLKSANITSLAPPAHWTYVWSPQGNLLRVSNYTSIQGLYAYDGLGRRVEAKEGSSTTFYAYEGTDTLAEIVPSAPSPDYVYANGIRIARTGGTVSTTYYITDALGSTRLVTDTSGRVVFSDNYQPFGSDNTSKGSETYKFTGKPVSQTTGLYYDYQRWYDPSIGRFISQDPSAGYLSDPQSLNPYVYVLDNPTGLSDPSGASPWYVDFLESLGPGNGILNIAQHFTGVNTDQLVGATLGPQAQEIFTGSRMLSGGAFLASGVVATAGIIAPAILGTAGSTVVTTGISGCTIEEGACQAGADALIKDLSDAGASSGTEALTKGATDDLVSTSRFWSTTERGGFDFEETEIHHLLPRQFSAFFARAGINVDDFTVQMDRGVHMVLHGRGGSYAESWNPLWQRFLFQNPNANSAQMLEYLKAMLEGFGF